MTELPSRYRLYGVFNPVGVVPGFVVPLFLNTELSNSLYVQIIGHDDRVRAFEALDTGDAVITQFDNGQVRTVGDLALWSFQFADGTCAVDVRDALNVQCDRDVESYSPLLRLQISTLFDRPDLDAMVGQSHRHLLSRAPRSAELWRDLVVLLPKVRRATFANLQQPDKALRAAIDGIDLLTRDETLIVAVPRILIEHFGGDLAFAQSLQALKPVLAALGIVRIDVQQRSLTTRPDTDRKKDPATSLALIHCLRDPDAAPARKLRDVRHIVQSELVNEDFKPLPGHYPSTSELSLLLVENNPDQIEGARAIAEAMGGRRSGVCALIVPGDDEKQPDQVRRLIIGPDRFAGLAGACQWLAFAGEVIDYDEERFAQAEINPHLDRHTIEIARWTPHALRACLTSGPIGQAAVGALHDAAGRYRGVSIATMASRGDRAATIAAEAALIASERGPHPAASAQFIMMVAFHNRGLSGEVRNEVERAVRACNPQARVHIVEEHREDMKKRVRVIAFTSGHQQVKRGPYTPPAKLMPLVRGGWKVGPKPNHARWEVNTVEHARNTYIVRFEPDCILTLDAVDDIIRATSFHHGKVALLVRAIEDDAAVNRLLSAGIFSGLVANRQSFDQFGHQPGAAMQRALSELSRVEICERLHQFARHYTVADLWHLVPAWQTAGSGTFELWRDGSYENEPELDNFELYRMTKEGSWYFRGTLRLRSTNNDVPELQYEFGLALEARGLRRTRLKPVGGTFDLRADAQRQFEERYYAERGRHFGKNASTRSPPITSSSRQLPLPGLSNLLSEPRD